MLLIESNHYLKWISWYKNAVNINKNMNQSYQLWKIWYKLTVQNDNNVKLFLFIIKKQAELIGFKFLLFTIILIFFEFLSLGFVNPVWLYLFHEFLYQYLKDQILKNYYCLFKEHYLVRVCLELNFDLSFTLIN